MTEDKKHPILEEKITKTFQQKYPMYSNGFKVSRKENTIILTLFDMEMKTDLEEIEKTEPVEGMSTEDMLWLELITHMDNLVETLQRDIVRGGLDELKEMVQKNILQIAEASNMDVNTLWLSFKYTMDELEKDLRRVY